MQVGEGSAGENLVQVLRLALVTETTEQELRGITKLSRCNLNKVCSLYELRYLYVTCTNY